MLLLVDDDLQVVEVLRLILQREGFSVGIAFDGGQAIERIKHQIPELAIIDLMLPDMHGFDVCEKIKRYADVPIIMLTGIQDSRTKVEAIRQYADDYIVKPFNAEELVARIHRVLHRLGRSTEMSEPEMIIDDRLRINFAQHWVEVDQERIGLTPTESRLLYVLARNAGRPVPNASLLARCWDDADEATIESLRVHIRKLREKIEPDSDEPRYLMTQRGIGYIFVRPGMPPSSKGKRSV